MSNKESGIISIADNVIKYQIDDFNWSVNISDVHLIGEYTTSNGPYIDDYFFVFLTAKENGWHEASFYAEGRDEVLAELSKILGTPIETGLCNSTEYRWRTLWPPQMKGKPFMNKIPKPTWLGRLLVKMGGSEDIELTDEAKALLPD